VDPAAAYVYPNMETGMHCIVFEGKHPSELENIAKKVMDIPGVVMQPGIHYDNTHAILLVGAQKGMGSEVWPKVKEVVRPVLPITMTELEIGIQRCAENKHDGCLEVGFAFLKGFEPPDADNFSRRLSIIVERVNITELVPSRLTDRMQLLPYATAVKARLEQQGVHVVEAHVIPQFCCQ